MDLELGLAPDDAARLLRLALLKPLRTGKAHTRAVRIVWHDDPDGSLAEQGLVLVEQRPGWRLERLLPDTETWPPGAPAPVLATGRDPVPLASGLHGAPIPLAAFHGHARTLALNSDHGSVVLTLLDGAVRTVAAERRVARLQFHGDEPAVTAVAMALAGELQMAVPGVSLAAEAISLARGKPPAPHHIGPPELPADVTVGAAFVHVVGHLTDVMLHFAPSAANGNDGPEPVHQMRVAVRRLRSAIKVFKSAVHCPTVAAVDTGLKALATRLAPTRDWDVFASETGVEVAAAFPNEAKLHRLLAAAERRRRACHVELRRFLESSDFRRLGIQLACLAGSTGWQASLGETEEIALASPLTDFAAHVLSRRLKRLAQMGDDIAGLEPSALHAIRLRAKRLRYAAEIFAPLYAGKSTTRFIRRVSRLQDRLGRLNDGAVAGTLLGELGAVSGKQAFAAGLVLGFIGAHGSHTREQIADAWQKFHRMAPFWE